MLLEHPEGIVTGCRLRRGRKHPCFPASESEPQACHMLPAYGWSRWLIELTGTDRRSNKTAGKPNRNQLRLRQQQRQRNSWRIFSFFVLLERCCIRDGDLYRMCQGRADSGLAGPKVRGTTGPLGRVGGTEVFQAERLGACGQELEHQGR